MWKWCCINFSLKCFHPLSNACCSYYCYSLIHIRCPGSRNIRKKLVECWRWVPSSLKQLKTQRKLKEKNLSADVWFFPRAFFNSCGWWKPGKDKNISDQPSYQPTYLRSYIKKPLDAPVSSQELGRRSQHWNYCMQHVKIPWPTTISLPGNFKCG